MSKICYSVNAKTGVVRAILKGVKLDAIRCIIKNDKNADVIDNKRYMIPNTIKAIALCNFAAGDVFSEEVGKKIAKERLLKQLDSMKCGAVNRYIVDQEAAVAILKKKVTNILEHRAQISPDK